MKDREKSVVPDSGLTITTVWYETGGRRFRFTVPPQVGPVDSPRRWTWDWAREEISYGVLLPYVMCVGDGIKDVYR